MLVIKVKIRKEEAKNLKLFDWAVFFPLIAEIFFKYKSRTNPQSSNKPNR